MVSLPEHELNYILWDIYFLRIPGIFLSIYSQHSFSVPAKDRLLPLISTMYDHLLPLLSLSSPMLGPSLASQCGCLPWATGAQEKSSRVSPGLDREGGVFQFFAVIFWCWALGRQLKFHANAKTLYLYLAEYLGLWPMSEEHSGFPWWRSRSSIIKQ